MAGQGFVSLENGKYKELYSVQVSLGVSSAGGIVALNSLGLIDTTMLPPIGAGTVTSVSAGTGMGFATITTSGSVSIDTTKVPYLASGFGVSAGLLKWSGSAWGIDTSTYITSGTGAGGNLGGTYPNPYVIGMLGVNFPTLPTSGSYQLQASITAGTVTSWSFVAPSSGSVTTVSVATANGFAGTVANSTTTPAITINTTITGILKGNATAISAAVSGTDYAPATSGSAILYGNGAGGFSNVTIGSGLTFSAGTLSAAGSGTVTSVAMTVPTGLSISGSPITTSGTLALSLTAGYAIPTTSQIISALTTTGTSGAATFSLGTLNIPQYQAALTNPITGTGTSNQVAYWSGTSTQTGSNNLYFDSTNKRLAVGGTTSPNGILHAYTSQNSVSIESITIQNAGSWSGNNYNSIKWRDGSTPTAAVGVGYDGVSDNMYWHSFYNSGYKNEGTVIAVLKGNGFFGLGSNPTAPNSNLFVDGSTSLKVRGVSANYTLTNFDNTVEVLTSSNVTITLMNSTSISGRLVYVVNSNSGTVTIATSSSQNFQNVIGTPTSLMLIGLGTYCLQSDGANWLVLCKF